MCIRDRTESISFDEPIVYHGYFDGWRKIADMMKLITCMEIMFIAICLSTVFTVEHTRKTDQVIPVSYTHLDVYKRQIFFIIA